MSSVADLAGVHELVSRLFEWPETEKEWEQYKLSDEQVAFFKENGYLANVKLLNSIQVESLRNELEEIADPNHPGHHLFYEFHSNESTDPSKVLFHALGAWRVAPGFHDVLWNPAFVMAASQLLGGSVRFWHDQLFCKPAKHGGVVAWHQDYSYWTRTKPMEHLTCWVGLDDADVDNGCLYYVPGSHRWGLLDKPDLAGDMNGLDQYLTEEQKSQFNPIPIEMKMGHGTFHHPLLVHGSYENKTDRQRRAYVTNVFKDGTRSDADTPLLAGADVVPRGQKMQGKFYPLLYQA
jgi:ectoine hydroxylase-related dioxygenase (phytanoyl-CoA dioxygenase family)